MFNNKNNNKESTLRTASGYMLAVKKYQVSAYVSYVARFRKCLKDGRRADATAVPLLPRRQVAFDLIE